MCIAYVLIPTGEIAPADVEPTTEWLRQNGFAWPTEAPQGRRPTAVEVRQAIETQEGFTVAFDNSDARQWHVSLHDRHPRAARPLLSVTVRFPDGMESVPAELAIEHGRPDLVLKVIDQLSRQCGSLILLAGENWPILVQPGIDMPAAVTQWLPHHVLLSEKYALREPGAADELLAFLAEHEGDIEYDHISQSQMDWYVAAYEHFPFGTAVGRDGRHEDADPQVDPRFVRGLLMSFGNGTGAGIDDSVYGAFYGLDKEVILPALEEARNGGHPGVRQRAIRVGADFPDPSLDALYAGLLNSADSEERYEAARYLENSDSPRACKLAKDALSRETDDYVRERLEQAAGASQDDE